MCVCVCVLLCSARLAMKDVHVSIPAPRLLWSQVLEDVSEEHARKTITVEPHPNLSMSAASIHPCRHGETMKRLVDNILDNGGSFGIEQ